MPDNSAIQVQSNLFLLGLRVLVAYTISENQRIIFNAFPAISTTDDARSFHEDNYLFQGGILFNKTVNERFAYTLGVLSTSRFGSPLVIPSVGFLYETERSIGAIILNLPLSFFIIILLLIIQFNYFRNANLILATIPLAIVGVTGGLLGTGSLFSFTAFLGIISLAGIIINDAMVLVDKIGSELAGVKSLSDSIKKSANDRFSPILLTTLTTSYGMIPLWTGGESFGLLWQLP